MPEETGRIGAYLLDADSPYRFVDDELYAQFRDEDFADRYPRDGQPSISPGLRILAPSPRIARIAPTAPPSSRSTTAAPG